MSQDLCIALVSTIAHSLWQGMLLAMLTAMAVALLRRNAHPTTRYRIYLAAMLLLIASPIATFSLLIPSRPATSTTSMALPDKSPPSRIAVRHDAPVETGWLSRLGSSAPSTETPSWWRDHARQITGAYLLGVAIMLIRTAIGLRGAARIRRTSVPVRSPELLHELQRLAAALEVRLIPVLASSARIISPCLAGLVRPIILLPIVATTGLSHQQLSAILAHELAHLRRRDHWISFAQRLIEAVLFFHPGVWWISRGLSIEREMCCDELVVALNGGGPARTQYADSLVRVAELCAGVAMHPTSSRALAMTDRPSKLRRRVARLLGTASDGEFVPQRRLAAALLAPIVLIALSAVMLLPSRAPARQATTQPASQPTFRFNVVDDATGQPLAAANLEIQHNRKTTDATCDDRGGYDILLDPDARGLDVKATAPHYVPMRIAWTYRGDDPVPLPQGGYTLRLPRGATVGGIVQDESGQPVANAQVYVTLPPPDYETGFGRGVAKAEPFDLPTVTDARGRWSIDVAPPQWRAVVIRAEHPDFYTPPFGDRTEHPDEALRAQTAVTVMTKGLPLNGTLRDTSGNPIAGATVAYDMDRGSRFPTTQSAADGSFDFPQARIGEVLLLAWAKGFAPQVREVRVEASAPPSVDLTMRSAVALRGRIVDENDRPLAAIIVIEQLGMRRLVGLEFASVETDADGRFSIDGSRDMPITIDILPRDRTRAAARSITLSPDQETVVRLGPQLRITGAITDANTGQPIQNGTVLVGHGGSRPAWQRHSPPKFRDGKYALTLAEQGQEYVLRFEADGYKPHESRVFSSSEGQVAYDVKLQPGQGPTGVVVDSAGKPVAGATVLLASNSTQVSIDNGRPGPSNFAPLVSTDAAGNFAFQPQDEDFGYVVVHDTSGFARVRSDDLANGSGLIKLQPWGRVEGTLRIGDKVAKGETIYLSSRATEARVLLAAQVKTDEQGRFVLERVPPEEASIGRMTPVGNRMSTATNLRRITVAPGETIKHDIGGAGRRLVGRIDTDGLPNEWQVNTSLRPTNRRPGPSYAFRIDPNGSFTIDDVEPGDYTLSIHIHAASATPGNVASLNETITVPDDSPDQPLDVGTLKLKKPERR